MKNKTFGKVCAAAIILAVVFLQACSNGGGSGSSGVPGTIAFEPSSNVYVYNGGTREVLLRLNNSAGVVGQVVDVTVSDPLVATVSPARCSFTSGTDAGTTCTLTLTGKKVGNFTLTARASGYADATATGEVGNTVQWGQISLVGAANNAATINYQSSVSGPYRIGFTATLVNSSGVSANSGVYAKVNTVSGLTFPNGQTCPLTSEQTSCTIIGELQQASVTPVVTTLVPSGSGASSYPLASNTTTISLVGQSSPTPSARGTITLTTQSGADVFYTGLNGPLFAVWNNGSGNDTYSISISSNSPALQFYSYPSGTNSTPNYSQQSNGFPSNQQTCQMSLHGGTWTNTNCGFGVTGQSASASATLSCTVTNLTTPGGAVPDCPSLTVQVQAQPTTGRQITFDNTSLGKRMYLGVTSGTSTAYTSPNSPLPAPPPSAGAGTPGGQSLCGSSSSTATYAQNACPMGSSCVQGGANVNSGVNYYCFWDMPANTNTWIPAGAKQVVTIPSVSGATSGSSQIQWSGNFYVYDDTCPDAICTKSNTPGTGANLQALTLAEVTYLHNGVDYYDVSIINGVNYALEQGPTNYTMDSNADAYSCGTAGSKSAMGGNASSNPTGWLPASSWSFVPTNANVITGITAPVANYFALVTSSATGSVTGWDVTYAKGTAPTFATASQSSGAFVGWATANSMWGWNKTVTNVAPFNLNGSVAVSPAYQGTSSVSMGDLQLCDNNTYTTYAAAPVYPSGPSQGQVVTSNMACGGVNWGSGVFNGAPFASTWGGTPTDLTRPSQGIVATANTNWIGNVLPTITWLKQACPTCYTFPYDDKSSTFTCSNQGSSTGANTQNYTINISNISGTYSH